MLEAIVFKWYGPSNIVDIECVVELEVIIQTFQLKEAITSRARDANKPHHFHRFIIKWMRANKQTNPPIIIIILCS